MIFSPFANGPTFVCSFKEIFDACVQTIPDEDPQASLKFRFNEDKFESLAPPSSEDANSLIHNFGCCSLILLPPFISGFLIDYLDISQPRPPDSILSFHSKHRIPTASSTCSFLFHHILIQWLISLPPPSEDSPPPSLSWDHQLFKPFRKIFRFLWVIHHNPRLITPLVPSRPLNFPQAISAFHSHRKINFPEHLASPPRLSHSKSAPASISKTSRSSSQGSSLPSSSQDLNSGKVRTTDDAGNIFYVSPEFLMMKETVSALRSNSKTDEDDLTTPSSKSLFRDIAQVFQQNLKLASITSYDEDLPSELSPIVKKLWKLKNTTTFYETLMAEVFSPLDNPCSLIFGQVPIIQRFGIRWKNEACPGGFSPFSFDPHAIPGLDNSNALDRGIRQKIHEASIHHINDFKSVDLQGIYSDHNLHFPRVDTEFEAQLRSFWCLVKGLFGEKCFLATQILRVLNHFYHHKSAYIANNQTSQDGRWFAQVLFMVDRGLQRFISNLNNPTDVRSINFQDTINHFDYIIFAVENDIPMGRLPAYLEAKFKEKFEHSSDRKRSSPSPPSETPSSKRPNTNNSSTSTSTRSSSSKVTPSTFSPPSEWKLPSNRDYRRTFTRSVLSNIPKIRKGEKDIPFCNLLFSTGKCKKGSSCTFCHDDPASHNKTEAMNEFYSSTYSSQS